MYKPPYKYQKSLIHQLIICLLMTKTGILALYLFTSLCSILSNPVKAEIFPTSIPWITDQQQCEHTNREWRNQKCWDNQHSLMF